MSCFAVRKLSIFVRILLLCHCLSFNEAFVLTDAQQQQGRAFVRHPQQREECRLPLDTNHNRQPLHMTQKDQQQEENDTDKTENQIAAAAASPSSGSKGLPNPKRRRGDQDVGGYDPSERIGDGINVGDPQIKVKEKERSVTSILKELAAIQQQGPQKYCILGTRHCSFLHQQIIELLAYALVLSGNHVYTSGAGGTHAATIRGALRAERPDLLTVVLPQSMRLQPKESQELLKDVDDVIAMPQNDEMPLDLASRICNSYLLSQTDQLISFAFHESTTVIEATKEAKKLDMLVTVLYLD